MPRSKIIYAWNYVEWGGAQIYTLGLIKFISNVFDIVVVLPKGSSQELLGFLNARNIAHEFFEPAADMTAASGLRPRLRRRMSKRRSEKALIRKLESLDLSDSVIHIDLGPQHSLLALARLCRHAPVFFTAHNSLPKFAAWRETVWRIKFRVIGSFKNFHVFCANVDTFRYISRFAGKKLLRRTAITPVGIDLEEINRALSSPELKRKTRERAGLSENDFVILTVGQFIDRKGRWILLEAAKQVLEKHPDVIFLWLMPRLPDEEETERIRGYGLGDSFRPVLSGSVGVTRQEILRFFRVADLFVLPSLLEGLPISLLEAMSLGIPSISTNVNAIPEAIIDGETGGLIQPGDPDALSRGIISLKEDSAMSKRIADTGREFVLKNFDERIAAEKALEMYKKALGMSERDVDIPKG